ncbi:MAG: hypothetical protein ACFFCD_09675 [Promethearchaeota archaeon]
MAMKFVIPLELKFDFALGGWTSLFKGIMYAIREKYGASAVLEIFERAWKMDDRLKDFTNVILKIFKIEENDMEAITKWFDIWGEVVGQERTIIELSKTFSRVRASKCPWKTKPKDISEWCNIFTNIVYNTINPKATFEKPKSMCAGDPYCEFVSKIEE